VPSNAGSAGGPPTNDQCLRKSPDVMRTKEGKKVYRQGRKGAGEGEAVTGELPPNGLPHCWAALANARERRRKGKEGFR